MEKDVALEFLKIREELKKFVTKDEFHAFKDEIATRDDEMLTILRRLDEDRHFACNRVNRLEETLVQHIADDKRHVC